MANDVSTVAKVVIIDNKDRVLFLKRSNYVDKFAGEWDLPGGHLKGNETLFAGLEREVEEETGLSISEPNLIGTDNNLHFFYCNYDSQPVKISHEHTEYRFSTKKNWIQNKSFKKWLSKPWR